MYALFTAIPLVGHLNPLIRQAAELQRRGRRVAIATFRELAAHVESECPGLPVVDLGPLGDLRRVLRENEEAASRDRDFARGTLRIVRGLTAVWPAMFDGLQSAIADDRPDVMVVDLFSSAGMCVADANGIPLVVNNPDLLASLPVTLLPPADDVPFLFSGRSIRDVGLAQRIAGPIVRRLARLATRLTIERDLNALRASRGLRPTTIDALLRDRTILVDGAFGLEYRRPIPPNVHMVGPMLHAEHERLPDELARWIEDGSPVVYANLGTLAVASNEQLEAMLAALTDDRFRSLWILKDAQRARLPKQLPESVRVLSWGPAPITVLEHPDVHAFVSHCGINSVYESIAAGTPIVGIPMFADQRDMAVRVADAGAGVWIDKNAVRAADLKAAIARVVDDPSFVAALPPLQDAFRARAASSALLTSSSRHCHDACAAISSASTVVATASRAPRRGASARAFAT